MRRRLTPDEFVALVVTEFELSTIPRLSDRIVEDVGLDSMQVFNLVALVEELIEESNPSDDIPEDADYPLFETLSDVFQYLDQNLETE